MKILLLTLMLVSAGNALAQASECKTEIAENGVDTKVISDDGSYLGYVSPNDDGTWFVWVQGEGASNQSYETRQSAIDAVCAS